MSLAQLHASLKLWQGRTRIRKALHARAQRDVERARANDTHPRQALIDRRDRRAAQLKYARDVVARRKRQIAAKRSQRITTQGGARGIVEQAVRVAVAAGGSSIYVGSDYRPGDRVGSGRSDHSGNDALLAARDIGKRGTNLLSGPPSPELDRACAAIGRAFGRDYGEGHGTVIDTFHWKGFRIQTIYRTPKYGDHRGHVHIGAKKL